MKSKFIGFVVVVILFVIGLGVFMNKSSSGPSKYDDFAKHLTTEGVKFYGAFWCPHCKAEKELFGTAVKYLPYVECSKPDRSSTQICIDEKIESYPTWTFKNGITLTSKSKPIVCDVSPGKAGENPVCQQIASQYFKTWLFPDYQFSIKSSGDPVEKDSIWIFPSTAETTGEVPLEFLAQQIGYTLPQQ